MQVVACMNQDVDVVMRGGVGGVLFSLPSGFESSEAIGLTADSCNQFPGEIDCRDSNKFLSCSAEVCLPRYPTILNSEGESN